MRGHVLDLFCGAAGGWSLGLERAGYRTVAACEIDDWRREQFARRHPEARMFADVRQLRADDLHGLDVDVLVGSPPCQDASSANPKGQGIDGAQTGLFAEWLRLVREVRPLWCGAENVVGLASRGLDRVCAELEAAGYEVRVHQVGGREVMPHDGPWHCRQRLWIVGARIQPEQVGRGARRDPFSSRAGEEASEPAKWGATDRTTRAYGGPHADEVVRDEGRTMGRDFAVPPRHALALDHDDGVRAASPHADVDAQPGGAFDEAAMAGRAGAGGSHGGAWDGRVAGLGRCLRMADGLSSRDARRWIAAYGDAVIPVIPEAIGRAMREVLCSLG